MPVLVTGDLAEWGKNARNLPSLAGAWSPRRIFGDATLPSGLPLALLLALVVLGVSFAAPHLGTASAVRSAVRRAFLGPSAATGVSLADVIQQAAVMLVLIVVGIAGLGFLLSVLLGNRWSSLTLLYLALVLAIALPFFSYALLSGPDACAAAHNPAVNSLYLCPFVPLLQLTDTLDTHTSFGRDSAIAGMAGYGVWPLWMGTGLIYLVIGLVSYVLALAILRRRGLTKTA